MSVHLSELIMPIAAVESKDYGSAGVDFESIHIGRLQSLCFAMAIGALTGNSGLTVNTGATKGTKTTAMAFKYRIGGGAFKAASADILGDLNAVTSGGLTLTAATFQHKLVTIDIDVDAMTDAQPWVTLSLDATATVLNFACIAYGQPRFTGHTALSVRG